MPLMLQLRWITIEVMFIRKGRSGKVGLKFASRIGGGGPAGYLDKPHFFNTLLCKVFI